LAYRHPARDEIVEMLRRKTIGGPLPLAPDIDAGDCAVMRELAQLPLANAEPRGGFDRRKQGGGRGVGAGHGNGSSG
jgi:hypothetical protein